MRYHTRLRSLLHTWAKLYAQWLPCAQDGVADRNPRCLLIDLNCRLVRIDTNDLCTRPLSAYMGASNIRSVPTSDKLIMSHTDELVHSSSRHVLRNYDGSGDAIDLAEARLAPLINYLG